METRNKSFLESIVYGIFHMPAMVWTVLMAILVANAVCVAFPVFTVTLADESSWIVVAILVAVSAVFYGFALKFKNKALSVFAILVAIAFTLILVAKANVSTSWIADYLNKALVVLGILMIAIGLISIIIHFKANPYKKKFWYGKLAFILSLISSAGSIFGAHALGFTHWLAIFTFAITIVLFFWTAIYFMETGRVKIGITYFLITMLGLSSLTNMSVLSIPKMNDMKLNQITERYDGYVAQIIENERQARTKYVLEKTELNNSAINEQYQIFYDELTNGEGSRTKSKGWGPTSENILRGIIEMSEIYEGNGIELERVPVSGDNGVYNQLMNKFDGNIAKRKFNSSDIDVLIGNAESFDSDNPEKFVQNYRSFVKELNEVCPYSVYYPVFDTRINHMGNLINACKKNPWIPASGLGFDVLILFLTLLTKERRATAESISRTAHRMGLWTLGIGIIVSMYGLYNEGNSWIFWAVYVGVVLTAYAYSYWKLAKSKIAPISLILGVSVYILFGALPDFSTNLMTFAEKSKLAAIENNIAHNWTVLPLKKDSVYQEVFSRDFQNFTTLNNAYLDEVGARVKATGASSAPTASEISAGNEKRNAFTEFKSNMVKIQAISIPSRPGPKEKKVAVSLFDNFQVELSHFNTSVQKESWSGEGKLADRIMTVFRAIPEQPFQAFASLGLVLLALTNIILIFVNRKYARTYQVKAVV
jgi:hypothetical protein